jgi:transposase
LGALLLPYKRIQEYLADQLQLPVSEGSIYNFNQQAYEQLAEFETISKANLVAIIFIIGLPVIMT